MEETKQLSSSLGVASLIVGIVGFLTGFIVIGILFDVIAIVLAIIALNSKKSKNGLAVAGMIIAIIGLASTILFFTLFRAVAEEFVEENQVYVEVDYDN